MTLTLTFTPMQPQHLPGAMRMSTDIGWPFRIEDWAFVLEISKGFVALDDDRVVAAALATPFGSVAMANLIIVDASMRGHGLGRKIIEQAMATIDSATWQLVATQDGLALYEKLGFRTIGEISQHQGLVSDIDPIGDAVWGTCDDLPAIKALDSAALNMDRKNLYDALSKRARFAVLRNPTGITGFAIIREFGRGRVIGPVIARSADEAKSLTSLIMSEHTGQFLRVDTDTHKGLGPWLAQYGLPKTGSGLTMQKGEPVSPQTAPQKIFALASQALG
jgi:GNAT superfamily N-acetyltransferase